MARIGATTRSAVWVYLWSAFMKVYTDPPTCFLRAAQTQRDDVVRNPFETKTNAKANSTATARKPSPDGRLKTCTEMLVVNSF